MKKVNITIIEILCAIVIVGVLSIMAISGISSLSSDNSSNITFNQEKINQTIEAYIKDNPNLITAIGSTKDMSLQDLDNEGYKIDLITDDKGNSCLNTSLVRFYLDSEKKIKYITNISCLENANFDSTNISNIQVSYDDVYEKFNDALFTIYYTEMNQSVVIDSYKYEISIINNGKSENVYESNWLRGEELKEIIVEENFDKYITSINNVDMIIIKAAMKNSIGKYYDVTTIITK